MPTSDRERAALANDAMADSRPLHQTILRLLDDRMVEAIAAEYRKGRLLLVMTTNLDAGRPVHASRTLSLAGLSGIVDYVPGDLTLTARAGTPLSEIERLTAAEGQWLTLDPFGDPADTPW